MAMRVEELPPLPINCNEKLMFLSATRELIVCDWEGNGIYLVSGGWNIFYTRDVAAMENGKHYVRNVWKFNMTTSRWTQLRSDDPPGIFASYWLTNLGRPTNNSRSRLLVLGGNLSERAFRMERTSNIYNDASIYDDERWAEITISGQPPAVDDVDWLGHAVDNCGDHLYAASNRYGDNQNGIRSWIEIHRLNLRSFIWEAVSLQNERAPRCRACYEIAAIDGKVYVFGGVNGFFGMICFDLVNIPFFDIEIDRWQNLPTSPDPSEGYPQRRSSFGCVKHNGNVYIIGGCTCCIGLSRFDSRDSLSDCWRLNLRTGQWTKLSISLPRPLWFPSVDVDRDGVLYIFGGRSYTIFDRERTNHLWRVRLVVQSLQRLAWDKILSCLKHEMITSDEDLLDLLPLPPRFLKSKAIW